MSILKEDEPYFKQVLAGRQVARSHPFASQMANFMYVLGDPATRQALIVDPAWDVGDLVDLVEGDGYRVAGALVTHYHPDHIGGDLFGLHVDGLAALLERVDVPVYANKHEARGVALVSGIEPSSIKKVDDGDTLTLGDLTVRFLHTPGHTPGSQCFLVGDRLVSGDTLFVHSCGRVDLPGGDPEALYHSLMHKLARLPRQTVLYPGHDYGPTPQSTIGDELARSPVLQAHSLPEFLRMMGLG